MFSGLNFNIFFFINPSWEWVFTICQMVTTKYI